MHYFAQAILPENRGCSVREQWGGSCSSQAEMSHSWGDGDRTGSRLPGHGESRAGLVTVIKGSPEASDSWASHRFEAGPRPS